MTRPESLLAVAVAELELLLEAEWELLPEAPARPVVILPLVILPASSGSNRMLACWLAMRRPSSWQCLQRPPLRRLRSPWFSSASWACRHLQPPLASAWSSPCSPRRWPRGSRRRSCPESARAESRRLRRLRSASWPCPVRKTRRASFVTAEIDRAQIRRQSVMCKIAPKNRADVSADVRMRRAASAPLAEST